MANPPVIIGSFDNVPAPGSPIKSDWPQEISTYVQALPRGLIGQVLSTTYSAVIAGGVWTDYAGMSITWTADPARRYKTTAVMVLTKLTNVGSLAAAICTASGIQLIGNIKETGPVNGYLNVALTRLDVGISGATTRKIMGWCDFTGAQFQPNTQYPAHLIVEDIGAVLPT